MFFTGLSKFFQIFIDLIGATLNLLLMLFPTSPFKISLPAEYQTLISNINYFLPIAECVAILEVWLVAVALYYAYSVYARFIKLIQ